MPKILKKVFSAAFGAFLLFATALRCIQLFSLTDASTGFIKRDSAGTMIIFFVSCLAFILLSAVLFKNEPLKNPFHKSESRLRTYLCIAAGIAMFYDFVYKCVACYTYYIESSVKLNYFIPVCLAAISALLCAFYFIMMGISFKTEHYDFRDLKYYHIVPVLWNLFILFSCLSNYNDGIFAEERILHYTALIFGILFFIKLIGCIDSDFRKLRQLCFFGFSYGALSFVLSVPRMIAFVFGADLFDVDFSAVTCFFMAVFAFSLSLSALKKDT